MRTVACDEAVKRPEKGFTRVLPSAGLQPSQLLHTRSAGIRSVAPTRCDPGRSGLEWAMGDGYPDLEIPYHQWTPATMRYSSTHKEETRRKLLAQSRAIAKRGGFATTGIDALMASIGLSGGAFYNHFASKQALFEALVSEEVEQSAEMLAGDDSSPPDHVARCLRNYLSSVHALHPENGCVLPTLGPEIARAEPAVREVVEAALKRTQKSWSSRTGDSDAAWALIAQCVGALVLARSVESERTRKEILAASRRFLAEALSIDSLR
ncbi:TetR family regulatory protein [Burkholderia paludis]|uniref:TetR family regulatory protein n=2 Tax=Burkholderiaceae TaxID=119060 RepID=A0A6J5DI39_9BURK|nr:hypothetical protein LMG30113_01804 [Burkholderia paludis]VWB95154.1 TetR family regulatory protein [Burkholderia paludis]